jgi:hypothetical protein
MDGLILSSKAIAFSSSSILPILFAMFEFCASILVLAIFARKSFFWDTVSARDFRANGRGALYCCLLVELPSFRTLSDLEEVVTEWARRAHTRFSTFAPRPLYSSKKLRPFFKVKIRKPGGSGISALLCVSYLSHRLSTRNLFDEHLNNPRFLNDRMSSGDPQ